MGSSAGTGEALRCPGPSLGHRYIVSPNGMKSLLGRRVVKPALQSACQRSAPGTACRRARVELAEMSLATPLFALAVPRACVQSSAGRSTWFRRRPSELGGDLRSAAVSSRPSARLHLRLFATHLSSELRATAHCVQLLAGRYLKVRCSGDSGGAHPGGSAHGCRDSHFSGTFS